MKKVGFVGWRGMVGSVLLNRMRQENDFHDIQASFYSTSTIGGQGPEINHSVHTLKDANNLHELAEMDIIVTCQGGDYTKAIYPRLRALNWKGYWIDAASALRMNEEACIVLDPVNRSVIDHALQKGIKTFVGGNCSITLSMMGLAGLLKENVVEWMSLMTYQSASGAGAKQVKELLAQNKFVADQIQPKELNHNAAILPLIEKTNMLINHQDLPKEAFGVPLVGNIIPWIDTDLHNGNSREEWKGEVELNKILGLSAKTIAVNGLCVRVGVIRCHSAAITMKLTHHIPEKRLIELITENNPWVQYIPNNLPDTLSRLMPASVSGSLQVAVGRYKPMGFGDMPIYSVFTVGDQLLWGAAEPLRRMLCILLGKL
ncbi:aspartate-semialdehyde dehydrogenase [Pelistega ratti]|uniref:aspartate-semialdehyde dehydrogenase n=1 Tax=Pelistega ratti TaxID=2652177 RepID=UPI0013581580|nr:aspartate-semialdehyde dehydrogenase [Pelistega ratti]